MSSSCATGASASTAPWRKFSIIPLTWMSPASSATGKMPRHRAPSSLLDHHFGRFDHGDDFVAGLEGHLIDRSAGNRRNDLQVADSDHNFSHDRPELDGFNLALELITRAEHRTPPDEVHCRSNQGYDTASQLVSRSKLDLVA